VFIAKLAGGKVQLLSSVNISGQLNLSTADSLLELNGKTLTLDGNVTGPGNFKGDGAATLNIGGTGSLGTLRFVNGFQTLSQMTINRLISGSVALGSNLSVDGTLNLTNGVVETGTSTLNANGLVSRTNGWIIGNEQRSITCANTCPTLTFDVGTPNGYSPVSEVLHVGVLPELTIRRLRRSRESIRASTESRSMRCSDTGLSAVWQVHRSRPPTLPLNIAGALRPQATWLVQKPFTRFPLQRQFCSVRAQRRDRHSQSHSYAERRLDLL
jgi:hypothetical protein